ncbi:MAG: lamin tail domain-containing protein, partial [Oscillospiraceae bacterium]|nr:lamin tail domain-containing protein [Oscillospiraceae bacterium]
MKKLDKEFFRALIPQGRKGKLAMALWFIVAAALLASCFMLGTLTDNSSGRLFPVYISEVLAGNTAYPNADGRCCDFIEIYNSADYPFDLSGYQLGDIAGGSRYAFPQGTIINPDSYYVVYCDELVEEPSYAPFAISRSGGESFYLIASNNAIVDSMTTIASDINRSMVLSEDGQWVLTDAVTPARANSATAEEARDIYNSGLSPLRITEFSAANSAYAGEYGLRCDWVELYNTAEEAIDISGFVLTDNIGNDKFLFPAGTTLSAHEYMVVYCSDKTQSPDVAPFGLSLKGGESLVLKNAQGMIIEMLECPATEGGSISLSSDGKWAATVEISPGYDNSAEGHR